MTATHRLADRIAYEHFILYYPTLWLARRPRAVHGAINALRAREKKTRLAAFYRFSVSVCPLRTELFLEVLPRRWTLQLLVVAQLQRYAYHRRHCAACVSHRHFTLTALDRERRALFWDTLGKHRPETIYLRVHDGRVTKRVFIYKRALEGGHLYQYTKVIYIYHTRYMYNVRTHAHRNTMKSGLGRGRVEGQREKTVSRGPNIIYDGRRAGRRE